MRGNIMEIVDHLILAGFEGNIILYSEYLEIRTKIIEPDLPIYVIKSSIYLQDMSPDELNGFITWFEYALEYNLPWPPSYDCDRVNLAFFYTLIEEHASKYDQQILLATPPIYEIVTGTHSV
jgi:hypothetical protein